MFLGFYNVGFNRKDSFNVNIHILAQIQNAFCNLSLLSFSFNDNKTWVDSDQPGFSKIFAPNKNFV